MSENQTQSPKNFTEPHCQQRRVSVRGIARSIVVFFLAWIILGVVANYLIPLDPPVAPEDVPENERLSNIVGAVVITLSAVFGLIELYLNRRNRLH
jgi:hypothetical protein